MAYIEYVFQGRHTRANLEAAAVTIGRSVDCTLQFEEDPEMSRVHCTILRDEEDGGHCLRDENASNGTFLNGARLGDEPMPLNDGDEIRAGHKRFTYRVEAEALGRTAMIFSEVEGRMNEGAGFHTIFTEIVKPKNKDD
jgi:pSer/pThr/pTyr-binding forkhead associated (FHA) protein